MTGELSSPSSANQDPSREGLINDIAERIDAMRTTPLSDLLPGYVDDMTDHNLVSSSSFDDDTLQRGTVIFRGFDGEYGGVRDNGTIEVDFGDTYRDTARGPYPTPDYIKLATGADVVAAVTLKKQAVGQRYARSDGVAFLVQNPSDNSLRVLFARGDTYKDWAGYIEEAKQNGEDPIDFVAAMIGERDATEADLLLLHNRLEQCISGYPTRKQAWTEKTQQLMAAKEEASRGVGRRLLNKLGIKRPS